MTPLSLERLLLPALLLLIILLPATGRAQITLHEYREAVLNHSYQLKEAEAASREAKAIARQAWANRLPQLAASGDFSLHFRHHEGIKPWDFNLQPEIVTTLYGEGLQAAYREADRGWKATQEEESFTRLDLSYAADYAYWNLSAMERYYEATQHYVEIIRSLHQIIEERFQEGYIAKNDVLMIESRLRSAEYDLLTATQNLEMAQHNFNILQGVESDRLIELAESILDPAPLPERVSYGAILDWRPDVRAARLRVEQAEEGVRRQRSTLFPRIEVGVRSNWHPVSPNTSGSTQIDGLLFGRLSAPLFGWGRRRQTIRAAEAVVEQRDWQEAQIAEQVLREERNGWSALIESHNQIAAADQGLRIAEESLDLSTYSYREGLLTILDVLQAQLDWIQLYTNAISAHFNFAVARSAYRRTIGWPNE